MFAWPNMNILKASPLENNKFNVNPVCAHIAISELCARAHTMKILIAFKQQGFCNLIQINILCIASPKREWVRDHSILLVAMIWIYMQTISFGWYIAFDKFHLYAYILKDLAIILLRIERERTMRQVWTAYKQILPCQFHTNVCGESRQIYL